MTRCSAAGCHCGPAFGTGADLLSCWNKRLRAQIGWCGSAPHSFELDQEAEAAAGLPPVDFEFDQTLLAGDDGHGQGRSFVCFATDDIDACQL